MLNQFLLVRNKKYEECLSNFLFQPKYPGNESLLVAVGVVIVRPSESLKVGALLYKTEQSIRLHLKKVSEKCNWSMDILAQRGGNQIKVKNK